MGTGDWNYAAYYMNSRVLGACLDMLTAVQAYPDRLRLRISCDRGIVMLVVWAHRILGLGVVVSGSPNGVVYFGDHTKITVFIAFGNGRGRTEVCLLDSDEKVQLIVDALDRITVGGEVKRAAKGYGLYELRNELPNSASTSDIVHIIC